MVTKKVSGLYFQSEETRRPSILGAALKDDGSLSDLIKKHTEDDYAKLVMLCQHYGIEPGESMFVQLSLALASEIYPEPKKRGRKSKWTLLNKGVLVVEVERLVRPCDASHGVAWACNQLAKCEPWKSFIEAKEGEDSSPDPAEALRKIYFHFCGDEWAKVARSAFQQYEAANAMPAWEKQVSDFVRNSNSK